MCVGPNRSLTNFIYWPKINCYSINANKNQITNPLTARLLKRLQVEQILKQVSISNHNKQTRRGRVKATKRGRLNIFYCLKGHSTQQKGLMSSPDKLLMPLCGKSGGRSHKSPKGGLRDIVLLLLILKGWCIKIQCDFLRIAWIFNPKKKLFCWVCFMYFKLLQSYFACGILK